MCEANAYLLQNGEEQLIMQSVDIVRPEKDGVYLQDIFGGQRTVRARIKEMNLVDHRILLEEEQQPSGPAERTFHESSPSS